MINQLRIEGYKMRRFMPFYCCIAGLALMAIYYFICGLPNKMIPCYSSMHDGFGDAVQDCSFAFLLGMLISWYVGSDLTNRTIHRSLVTGCNRWMIVVTRIMATSVLTALLHVGFIAAECIGFGKQYGFSFEGFGSRELLWLGVVVLQLIAYNELFVPISIFCGNVYSALFVCVSAATIGGNILRNVFHGNYIYEHSFFCFAKSSTNADLIPCAVCAIVAIVILTVDSIIIFNKKDLSN